MAAAGGADGFPSMGGKTDDEQVEVNCMWAFNAAVGCPMPANQFTAYYRFGEFETCGEKLNDFGICLWAKLQHSQAKRKEVLSKASYMQAGKATESVLKPKEKPGW
mmetsp:Transcript_17391/g.53234  ORF Transcript_17391/g.53234 Transcript_17391/m.53234 type:complete len:106 (-) Transcript_17391:1656-1973(-)